VGRDLTPENELAGGRWWSEVACAIVYSEIWGSEKELALLVETGVEVGVAGERSRAGGSAAAAGGAGKHAGEEEERKEPVVGVGQMSSSLAWPCWANTWHWEGDRGREMTGVQHFKNEKAGAVAEYLQQWT
jgi:hypothetical protein